jgi:uncharacterized membrane protein YgdD (TMEM256/DUF423 family)
MTVRLFAFLGALNGALAVAAGAFGAHALKTRLSADLQVIFETGARYHFYHSLALFAAAWLASRNAPGATAAGWSFVGGIVLFSGSLYVLALTGQRWLGAVTPVGGVAFLAGWVMAAYAALRTP